MFKSASWAFSALRFLRGYLRCGGHFWGLKIPGRGLGQAFLGWGKGGYRGRKTTVKEELHEQRDGTTWAVLEKEQLHSGATPKHILLALNKKYY